MTISNKMFLASAAAALASTSAFVVPVTSIRSVAPASSSSLHMSAGADYASSLPGKPFGDGLVFDPLNLADGASPGDIKRWREAELKHGRVAMLAALGVLVAESFHPLFEMNEYIGPAVGHFQEITSSFPQFWVAALFGVGLIEYQQINKGFASPEGTMTGEAGMKEDYTPGDLGFDPLGIKPQDEESFNVMQTKELNNGRLAMIGVAGMLVQELVQPEKILSFLGL